MEKKTKPQNKKNKPNQPVEKKKEEKLKKKQCFAPRVSSLVVIKTAWEYTCFCGVQSQHWLQVIPLLQSKYKLLGFLAALINSHLWTLK